MAGGYDIRQYHLDAPAVRVSYSLAFEEMEARVAAGLSAEQYDALPGSPLWVDPANPTQSKCEIVAWYRLSRLIPVIQSEAEMKKRKR
jgi:hypothetical protein